MLEKFCNKDLDFTSVRDEVEEMNLVVESAGAELQAYAVVLPLTAEQPPDPNPENEALDAAKELEKDSREEGEIVKNWTQKDADAKHPLLGEISQMNELLEQLPEIMESDAFSLTNATREEDETGNKNERDDVPPHATTEVDTTKVVKTPEVAEEVEIENREGQEKEDKESKDYEKTNDMQEEENLPNEEENIPYLSIPEFLHNNFPPPNGTGIDSSGNIYALRLEDEVDMTEVMAIESAGKGGSEQASAEDENQKENKRPDNEDNAPFVAPYISAGYQEFLHNNFPPSNGTAIPGPGGMTVLTVREEEVEMAREMPTGEEDLPHDEEAAYRRKAQLLPTDEVNMTSVVITDSVDKGENEQNGQANPGKDPTLDEAADIIKTGDTTAITSKKEGRTAAKERTADQAGSPDGGAAL